MLTLGKARERAMTQITSYQIKSEIIRMIYIKYTVISIIGFFGHLGAELYNKFTYYGLI